MLRFKRLSNKEMCIVDNGSCYIFNNLGVCIKEDMPLLPEYTSNTLELPIISILSSQNKTDIYVFTNDNKINIYNSNKSVMECMSKLSTSKFIQMLRREGKQENIRFNQLVFIYKEGTDVENIAKEVI